MALRTTTLAALISVIYFFVSRTLGTYWPALFFDIKVAQMNSVVSVVAALLFVLFYVLVYTQFNIPGKPVVKLSDSPLKTATIAAIVGSVMAVLVFAKGVSLIYGFMDFLYPDALPQVSLFLVWGSALGSLYFAVVFYNETLKHVSAQLVKAARIAVIGASLGFVLRTYLLLNFYYSSMFKWSGQLSRDLPLAVIPVILFIVFANVWFLWAFYRELGKKNLLS